MCFVFKFGKPPFEKEKAKRKKKSHTTKKQLFSTSLFSCCLTFFYCESTMFSTYLTNVMLDSPSWTVKDKMKRNSSGTWMDIVGDSRRVSGFFCVQLAMETKKKKITTKGLERKQQQQDPRPLRDCTRLCLLKLAQRDRFPPQRRNLFLFCFFFFSCCLRCCW